MADADDPLALLRRDWQRHLRGRNLAANTRRIYDTAVWQLLSWLAEQRPVTDPGEITRADVEGFIAHVTETRTAATANVTHGSLRQWFKWMLSEGEIETSPMRHTSPPIVPAKAVPVLSIEQLRALLDQCAGRDLVALRDTAIIRLLVDTGGRLGERHATHAHRFRHTAAHRWMAEGANETDLMRIMGWRSPQMLCRYAPPRPTSAPARRTGGSGSVTACSTSSGAGPASC